MKRILISEEEKSRILNLHQNLGYTTSLNEQNVPQQPQANVQKPNEALSQYFLSDPMGKKIASISPIFAKLASDNKIQPYKAKFELQPNNTQITAVGTDGKEYIINFNYIPSNGIIPQGSEEKLDAATEVIKQKVTELNIGQVKSSNCFILNTLPPSKNINQSGTPNTYCKAAYDDYDKVVASTGFNNHSRMNEISKFLSVAPKNQPKQG